MNAETPISQMYVVEYSLCQQHFHIHQVEDMLEVNLRSIVNRVSPGYIPIAIVNTHTEANDYIDHFLDALPVGHAIRKKIGLDAE